MAFIGVFGLLQLVAFSYFVRQFMDQKNFKRYVLVLQIMHEYTKPRESFVFFGRETAQAYINPFAFVHVTFRILRLTIVSGLAVGIGGMVLLTSLGVILPWAGRFYSLWDTGYAKIHIPIIASVSEHQPTSWTSFFFDLQMLVPMIPVGIFCCFQNLTDENVFIILYGVTSVYFAGVMVRLMLTLTPVACILAAIGFSYVLDTYLRPAPVAKKYAVDMAESGESALYVLRSCLHFFVCMS